MRTIRFRILNPGPLVLLLLVLATTGVAPGVLRAESDGVSDGRAAEGAYTDDQFVTAASHGPVTFVRPPSAVVFSVQEIASCNHARFALIPPRLRGGTVLSYSTGISRTDDAPSLEGRQRHLWLRTHRC